MWFGTQEGLNRYDGFHFLVYKTDILNESSIACNYVLSSFEDSDGNLWFGTADSILLKYDRLNNKFENYKLDIQINNSTSGFSISSIDEVSKGKLWLGCSGPGLIEFDRFNFSYKCRKIISVENDEAIGNKITCMKTDGNGKIWIGTWDEGLIIYNYNSASYEQYRNKNNETNSISHNRIRFISEDSSGNYWIGTARGLNKFDKDKKMFSGVSPINDAANIFKDDCFTSMNEDKENIFWFGTRKNGLVKYNLNNDLMIQYKNDFNNFSSISNDFVIRLYRDRTNVLWIGTVGGGLNRIDNERKKFYRINNLNLKFKSPNANQVSCIISENNNELWLGNYTEGIIKINTGNDENIIFSHGNKDGNYIGGQSILAIAKDINNDIWIGTRTGGLNKFDRNSGRFISYFFRDEIDENIIFSLHYNSEFFKDFIFLGTVNYGLLKFDINKKKFTSVVTEKILKQYFEAGIVKSIFIDRKGNIFAGTNNNGLYIIDKDNKLSVYNFNKDNPDSLSDNSVNCIHSDSKNNYWIGTFNGGLNKFNFNNKSFIQYTTHDGLPDNGIKGILEDISGNLWLSTNKGISKFNPLTSEFRNYYSSDGLQSNEFNERSYHKSCDGTMYFGGINGVSYFKPGEIKDNPYIPEIVITDFKIFNESVKHSPDNPFLKNEITETKEINLSYRESVFSFEFAALIYNNPKKNEYAYKMEGFDKEWVYCGTRRQVTYTNLDPGEYIFRVKGSNNDGVWNEEGTSLKINISPPFWKTWWFKSLGLMSLAGATSLAYQQKLTKVRKENKLQQEFSRRLIDTQEKERKNIASELHDTIAHDILITKNRIVTGIQQTDDIKIKNMLNDISELSAHTLNDVRNISHNLSPHILEELGLTKAINSIIRKVSQTSELIFTESIDNIDDMLSKELEINIYRIIQECINNIFKHSGATEANLKITKENELVKLIITDNGKGISNEDKKGFGMKGLNERIKLYNGNLIIDSGPGKGMRLIISFPVKNPNIE